MEIEVAELKLVLKQWELDFLKKNGRKPTKNDAAKCPEMKEKYDKFISLKKKLQDSVKSINPAVSESKENNQNEENSLKKTLESEKEKKNTVWGTSLLKKNAIVIGGISKTPGAEDFDTDDPPEQRKDTKKADSSPEEKIGNWRENMRKNIGLDVSKKLPTSLKKRTSLLRTDKQNPSSNSITESPLKIVTESKNPESQTTSNEIFGSQVKIFSKSSLIKNESLSANFSSPKNSYLSPKIGPRKSSFLSKPIKMDFLPDEDLSDLASVKDNITENNTEEAGATNNVNSNEMMSPFKEIEPRVTQNFNLKLEKSQNSTENFIEANFRQKTKSSGLSFSSEKLAKIDYDAVYLPSKLEERKPENGLTEADEPTESSDVARASVKKTKIGSAATETGSKVSKSGSTGGGGCFAQPNYRRINLKKKSFSRKGGSGTFLRKQVFREKMAKKGYSFKSGWKGRSGGFKSGGWKSGGGGGPRDKSGDKCFKCGGTGHWASNCKGQGFQKKTIDPEEEEQNKESLEEILTNIDLVTAALKGESSVPLRPKLTVEKSEPVLSEDAGPITEDKDVMAALKMFKYTSFRPGQEKAISRILRGLPTLLVLSTGSGKSLCYQLPAYLYATKKNAITLVVSPLVSLMDDQVRGLPRMMKATRIHSGMTKDQRDKAMAEVESGKVHVLLLSPEALTSWAGMSAKYSPLSKLPPIAFVCIDECHCLSEWSHSFRPSYLRVCQVLRDQLGIKCLVGLTATATMDTCASVARQLGMNDSTDGIIAKIEIPTNLCLSVSKDKYKDEALSQLLIGDRFSKLDSVIVYCTRRDEAARIAGLLRVKMQDMPALDLEESESEQEENAEEETGTKKRKRKTKAKKAKRKVVTLDAECYHAGMSAAERRRIQNRFMNGTLRVVVATVAFGMGIDKQDVRSVIHYNMPMSFERYVQEVGRAGRDGKPAHCHLFLDSEGGDLCELSRHSYGKTVDRYTIKKFVKKVFPKCNCRDEESSGNDNDPDDFDPPCNGHFVSVDIDKAIEDLDVKREGLETLLCYLELEGLIHVHLPMDAKCNLSFYGGPGQMMQTARKCPAVAVALKIAGTKENESQVEFDAMKVADELNMDLPALKKLLRYLTWDTTLSAVRSEVGKSGIEVEFSQPSFCVQTKRKSSDEFLDAVTDLLHRRVVAQENKEIAQLRMCFETMQKFSHPNVGRCRNAVDIDKSTELKSIITEYFKQTQESNETEMDVPKISAEEEGELRSHVRQFLHLYANDLEHQVTGRAIARIFHGVDSPRYPATSWGPARRFWRSKLHVDFNLIRKIATEEIIGKIR